MPLLYRILDQVDSVSGKLYFVIGPSGSGKDSLIGYAKACLDRSDGVLFPRRFITRPPDGRCEQHIPLNKEQFLKRAERGEFLMCWQAHSLSYAIDKSVLADLRAGFNVVINGSRAYLEEARVRVPELVPVVVTAPEKILLERLQARQCESESELEIKERLQRARKYDCCGIEGAICFHNDRDIKDIGREFCQMLVREHAVAG
ncbi:MAG: phosphonate metabolism protein/1,5-bisphosphokinase (PRPP-forming) PhnN [Granulosicoccaceae bacterium]